MKGNIILLLLSLMTFATSMAQDDVVLTCPDDNHPHAIDLGLPSGTKWACCNVGADKPEAYGGYYAWGETEEKAIYDWASYTLCDGRANTSQNLGSDIAGTSYDVAHVKWGGAWMMPSIDRVEELLYNCTCEWTTVNGVEGVKFTSEKNGGTIFLPAAGQRWKSNSPSRNVGFYWTSSQLENWVDDAYSLLFFSSEEVLDYNFRGVGISVRPIMNITILGDVNGDGTVNIADVTIMVAYVLGEPQTGFIVTNADVNGDGNITITDVSEIVGLILDVKDMERPAYVPFVEEGKTWYCGYWHPYANFPSTPEDPGGEGIDCIFTMCGDTLVNGKDYKKVYCQFEEYYGDNEQHYYCAVREEAYRVFIMEEGTTEEKLLYDFSRPNEMITLNYDDYRFARSKGAHRDDFLPGQLEYHVYKFTEDGEVDYINDSSSWIDGVGDYLTNPFAFEFRFLPYGEPKFGKDISVITCMKDGKYIFNNEWMAVPQYAPGAKSFTAQKHME